MDAHRLAREHICSDGFRIPRAKTGKTAIGTLSARTRRLMDNYLKNTPETICGSPLFRNRSRAAYSKDTLGDDFRAVRARIFPGDTRMLMDARRSGATGALAGGASAEQIGSKMANSIATNPRAHIFAREQCCYPNGGPRQARWPDGHTGHKSLTAPAWRF